MSIQIIPIAETHAESFRACLDAVAREKKYLAQIEALPIERIQAIVWFSLFSVGPRCRRRGRWQQARSAQ